MKSSAEPVPYFEPLLDPKAAAALVHIHEKTLIRLARVGEIPGKKIGKLWRFRASQLDSWFNGQTQ